MIDEKAIVEIYKSENSQKKELDLINRENLFNYKKISAEIEYEEITQLYLDKKNIIVFFPVKVLP